MHTKCYIKYNVNQQNVCNSQTFCINIKKLVKMYTNQQKTFIYR